MYSFSGACVCVYCPIDPPQRLRIWLPVASWVYVLSEAKLDYLD